MADNPDIDVVYVVTPNGLHLDNALAAAQAGKHVFCEKPMEISVERCQQMIDAVKAAEPHARHWLPLPVRAASPGMHALAREREFGAPKLIDAHFGIYIGPSVWRLNRALAGGGPLMDVGIYALQATRYLTGEEPMLDLRHDDPGRSGAFLGSRRVRGLAGEISGRRGQSLRQQLRHGRHRLLARDCRARLVRPGTGLQLRRHPRHAQRRQGDRSAGDRPVRRGDGRLRALHHGRKRPRVCRAKKACATCAS